MAERKWTVTATSLYEVKLAYLQEELDELASRVNNWNRVGTIHVEVELAEEGEA